MSAMDENEDESVSYGEYIEFMYDVLCHLEREEYIQDVAFQSAVLGVQSAEEAPEESVEEVPAAEG